MQLVERSCPLPVLRYSPARMATGDDTLSRDAALAALRQRILAAARRRLSPADAEDLTQEALLLLTTKYAHVHEPSELVALGLGILRKKRADLWRKAARRGETKAEDAARLPLPDAAPAPDTVATDRERLRLLAEAASRLGERCRQVLRRKLEGMSFVEIAAEMGRPVNTVYSWDFRCHARLRALLGERWGFVAGEEER
jgi:RNA polymerase sigma factor (sigma-70 family)